jgi:branched-chain amino acid transport system permease protein
MFYREAGQFKTSYEADGQILPIRQDRIALLTTIALALLVLPMFATPYFLSAILIPFLIFALAALGLNILTGYAGQLSLGTAAFMAVGAFASWNFIARVPGMPMLLAFVLGGLCAAMVGIAFGLPSLRIRGFYLAASTLATQFFVVWCLTKISWLTGYSASGRDYRAEDRNPRLRLRYTRPANTCWCWRSSPSWRCWRKIWCARMSAVPGWRSAIWTWRRK